MSACEGQPRQWRSRSRAGRINWIFSDKTGTLTANEMRMVNAVVDGRLYKDVLSGPLLYEMRAAKDARHSQKISEFLFSLAVGHSVTIGEVQSDATAMEKSNSWQRCAQTTRASFLCCRC